MADNQILKNITTTSPASDPDTTSGGTTASPEVKETNKQQVSTNALIDENIASRTENEIVSGILSGRRRIVTEDTNNTKQRELVQKAILATVRKAVAQTTVIVEDTTTSTTNDRVENLQSQATKIVSKKETNDTVRSLQKLQMKCNHTFSLITKRCTICNKHRDSHYYD